MSGILRLSRRRFLGLGVLVAAGGLVPARPAAASTGPQALALRNLHTGEALEAVYRIDGRYVPEALRRIDRVLRDHRTDEVHAIDPRLLDLLSALRSALGSDERFEVISGYRSPATNAALVASSTGVSRGSLHVAGMAIDIRLPGRSLGALRDAGRSLGRGGVGYYPRSGFVHVDVGRVRYW